MHKCSWLETLLGDWHPLIHSFHQTNDYFFYFYIFQKAKGEKRWIIIIHHHKDETDENLPETTQQVFWIFMIRLYRMPYQLTFAYNYHIELWVCFCCSVLYGLQYKVHKVLPNEMSKTKEKIFSHLCNFYSKIFLMWLFYFLLPVLKQKIKETYDKRHYYGRSWENLDDYGFCNIWKRKGKILLIFKYLLSSQFLLLREDFLKSCSNFQRLGILCMVVWDILLKPVISSSRLTPVPANWLLK